MSRQVARVFAAGRGTLALAGLGLITLIGAVPLVPVALAKRCLPGKRGHRATGRAAIAIASNWARACYALIVFVSGAHIAYTRAVSDDPSGCYLLVSNHQCFADALLLVAALHERMPFPRFCVKRSLRWFPVVGLALWALDYVFVTRYSTTDVRANPRLRGRDAAHIRAACEKFRHAPVTLVNYLEGTRATAAKRAAAGGRYRALLPPKAGGFTFALHGLGDMLDGVLDISVAYVDTPEPSFWKLLSGRIPGVAIRLRRVALPPELVRGDYDADPAYRARVKAFLEDIWAEKDAEVAAIADPMSPQRAFRSAAAAGGASHS